MYGLDYKLSVNQPFHLMGHISHTDQVFPKFIGRVAPTDIVTFTVLDFIFITILVAKRKTNAGSGSVTIYLETAL